MTETAPSGTGGEIGPLRGYLNEHAPETGVSTIPFAGVLRPLMSPSSRLRAKQVATYLISSVEKRKAREASTVSPLRLHLGSGGNNISGWVNIDLVGLKADICWDIRNPLPFSRGSADAVFLEHVLEHLSLQECIQTLDNIRPVLRLGGMIRIGVPDAGLYATSYLASDDSLERLRPGRPTKMIAMAEVFQEHGHISAWDGETLCLLLRDVGFSDPKITPGGISSIEPAPDSPSRIPESVYVEARADR